MKYQYDDGGRAAAGYKGSTGDCVTRAIAIATGKSYQEVYDALNALGGTERTGTRKRGKSNSRTGVYKTTQRKYLASLGWVWHPTMLIGSGCKVHLTDGELPMGKLIVSVSKHLCAVIDGVIHDIFDPQREIYMFEQDHGQELKPNQGRNQNGVWTLQRRCVYGYWTEANS